MRASAGAMATRPSGGSRGPSSLTRLHDRRTDPRLTGCRRSRRPQRTRYRRGRCSHDRCAMGTPGCDRTASGRCRPPARDNAGLRRIPRRSAPSSARPDWAGCRPPTPPRWAPNSASPVMARTTMVRFMSVSSFTSSCRAVFYAQEAREVHQRRTCVPGRNPGRPSGRTNTKWTTVARVMSAGLTHR